MKVGCEISQCSLNSIYIKYFSHGDHHLLSQASCHGFHDKASQDSSESIDTIAKILSMHFQLYKVGEMYGFMDCNHVPKDASSFSALREYYSSPWLP